MSLPNTHNSTYVNPNGNLAASGAYRSHLTQKVVNMMPPWMHMRDNPNSVGQNFLNPLSVHLENIEKDMAKTIKEKFILTAPENEIDVLYRMKLPSNIDLTNASASGVRCLTAPSGIHPSGVSDHIRPNEIGDLEEFYYYVLPTRMEVFSSGDYTTSIEGRNWYTKPSGVTDGFQKKVDIWKKEHNLTWCYTNNTIRKQDSETFEDYEIYNITASGTPIGMDWYENMLWWVGKGSVSDYYLNLTSTRTQMPVNASLDTMAIFNITSSFDGFEPSGVIVGKDGTVYVSDTMKSRVYTMRPKYDYFIVDKENRYVYFREDYSDPGVFISNT